MTQTDEPDVTTIRDKPRRRSSSRRSLEDKEAKDRARRERDAADRSSSNKSLGSKSESRKSGESRSGSRDSSGLSKSRSRENLDMEAKNRARRERHGGASRPGAVSSSSSSDRGSRKAREDSGRPGAVSSSSSRDPGSRKTREDRNRPGVLSSSDSSDRGSRKAREDRNRPSAQAADSRSDRSRRKEERNRAQQNDSSSDRRRREEQKLSRADSKRDTPQAAQVQDPQATSSNGDMEVHALLVEETDEREALKREIRAELQAENVNSGDQTDGENEGPEDSVDENSNSNRKKKCVVLILILIVIVVVGAYFGTNGFKSKDANPVPAATATSSPTAAYVAIDEPVMDPSSPPSSPPSVALLFDAPLTSDCDAIANGQPVATQGGMPMMSTNLKLEMTLSTPTSLGPLLEVLQKRIQDIMIPILVGCADYGPAQSEGNDSLVLQGGENVVFFAGNTRQLVTTPTNPYRYAIGNGDALGITPSDNETCEGTCYVIEVPMDLYLREDIKYFVVATLVGRAFGGDLVRTMGLADTLIRDLKLAGVFSKESTEQPSVAPTDLLTETPSTIPSGIPSWQPSDVLSTGGGGGGGSQLPLSTAPSTPSSINPIPTPLPTVAPTLLPTPALGSEPQLPLPTARPAPVPTIATPPPTVTTGMPTKRPTVSPTKTPTKSPTRSPTKFPTKRPTPVPTGPCGGFNARSFSGSTLRGVGGVPFEVDFGFGSMRASWGPLEVLLGYFSGYGPTDTDDYSWTYSNGSTVSGCFMGRSGSVHMQFVSDAQSYSTFTDNGDCTYHIELYISTTTCALPADVTPTPTASPTVDCSPTKCIGQDACTERDTDQDTISCNSCVGELACNYRHGSVGESSCIGISACHWSFGGTIGTESCIGWGACQERDDGASVGDNSCLSDWSCTGHKALTVGSNSCLDPYSCACRRPGQSVPDNSCQNAGDCCRSDGAPLNLPSTSCLPVGSDYQTCTRMYSPSIGERSCNNQYATCFGATATIGNDSCNNGGCMGVMGTIGNRSCNGNLACQWNLDMTIGNDSCNCEECCKCFTDENTVGVLQIPANSCNSKAPDGVAIDFVNGGAGPFLYCC